MQDKCVLSLSLFKTTQPNNRTITFAKSPFLIVQFDTKGVTSSYFNFCKKKSSLSYGKGERKSIKLLFQQQTQNNKIIFLFINKFFFAKL